VRHPAAFLVGLCLAGCGQAPPPSEPAAASPAKPAGPVKITHFYAGAPEVETGATVGFCYGVENARAVRIEPPVDELMPGYNRCFYIALQRTATYRLIADGLDGTSATQSVTVKVKPAPRQYAAPAANRGLFTMIFSSAPEISAGESVTLCYGAPDAVDVQVDPPVQQLKPAERYCFAVRPERTTTYTFSARSRSGNSESATLPVKVR
jgi:hypothetical protein